MDTTELPSKTKMIVYDIRNPENFEKVVFSIHIRRQWDAIFKAFCINNEMEKL